MHKRSQLERIKMKSESLPAIETTQILVHGNVYEKIHSLLNGGANADRVTALINVLGSKCLKSSSRGLGSPGIVHGKYLSVNGNFSEREACLIRATLKYIGNRHSSVNENLLGRGRKSGIHFEGSPSSPVQGKPGIQKCRSMVIIRLASSVFSIVFSITSSILAALNGLKSRLRATLHRLPATQFPIRLKPETWCPRCSASSIVTSEHTPLPVRKLKKTRKFARAVFVVALYCFALFGLFSLASIVWVEAKINKAAASSSVSDSAQQRHAPSTENTGTPESNPAPTAGIFSASENMSGMLPSAAPAEPVTQVAQQPTFSPPREVEVVTGHADMPSHRFYVFSDPLCPFCKRFEPVLEQVASMKGMEMHLFPTPVHDGSIILVNKISCAANRGAAWSQSIATETAPDCAPGKNAVGTASLHASQFFESLHLQGTPTVINDAGLVHAGGFSSATEMVNFLNQK